MFVKEELKDYTGGNEVKEEKEQNESPTMPPKGDLVCSIPLPSKKATLTIYGELSPEDIKFIEGFLNLYKKEDEPKE